MARQQTVSGRRRARPDAERIAKRLREVEVREGRDAETGVLRLNPGFFTIERIRAAGLGKKRARQRPEVRSK